MTLQEQILDRLCDYLANSLRCGGLELAKNSRDGRVNSQASEQAISKALLNFAEANDWFKHEYSLRIEISKERHWFDFAVHGDGLFLPVNVKVSAFQSSDNLSSKEGVFYALTGVQPETVKIHTWDRFLEQLSANLGFDSKSDYYFLVVDKVSVGHVFWTSLKRINQLDPNGNNPPFQCHWGKNQMRKERAEEDACRYVLAVLGETFRLRAEAWNSFKTYFPAPNSSAHPEDSSN